MDDENQSPDPYDVRIIRQLVSMMGRHDLSEIDLREGDRRIRLRRETRVHALPPPLPEMAAPVRELTSPTKEPAPAAAPEEAPPSNLIEIRSPAIGVFYAQSNPDAPPYVSIGSRVTPSTVVCQIEAMKIFNEITADCSGVIKEILVKNKEPVEFNTVLFRVDPNG